MAKKTSEQPATAAPLGDGIVRANINRELVAAANYVSLYVNDTQIQVTPWDFRLMFGVITGLPSDELKVITIQQIGEIRMSPQHAKRLAMVLIQQLQVYEKNVGPIPQPQD